MTGELKRSVCEILPYAAWMVLMVLLPSTATAYAVRTAVVFALLVPCLVFLARQESFRAYFRPSFRGVLWGVAVGLLVLVIWVAPENLSVYRTWCIFGEGGTDEIDASSALLKSVRLFGSACVISVAEELFFRKWLVRFAGFVWMVALFALEHDRWLVGAIAGILYGILMLRKGLLAAITAHFTTNLALGFYVLQTGAWRFW